MKTVGRSVSADRADWNDCQRVATILGFVAVGGDWLLHLLYGPLPPEAVTGLIAHLTADRRAGQARELDFTPWGGAYNRARQTATAFAHRTPLYLVKHTASAQPRAGEAETAAARRWARRSWQQLHRWGTGQVFPSFPDPDLRDWGHAYYGVNYRRLLAVKARYDAGNRFRSRQRSKSPRAAV